jgi:hypothetical protein
MAAHKQAQEAVKTHSIEVCLYNCTKHPSDQCPVFAVISNLRVCLVELLEPTSRLQPQNLNQTDFFDASFSKRGSFLYVQIRQSLAASSTQLLAR